MKKLSLDATIENVPVVTDFINAELESFGCSVKSQTQIDVAVDELFGNIAYYAYDDRIGQATVAIDIENNDTAVITFTDSGKPYNPLQHKDPDIALPVEERNIGGLGIYMVKKSMDYMSYEYRDGKNILCIKKKL